MAHSELTWHEVEEIRSRTVARGDSKALASEFKVSRSTISMIRQRRIWNHVPEDIGAEWRAIPNFGRYEASATGRIRRAKSWFPLTQTPDERGRLNVCVFNDSGRQKTEMVHRLVAQAFFGPVPVGLVVCHNNGDNADNRIENLRYDTQAENIEDIRRHGHNQKLNRTHCIRDHEYTEENTALRVGVRGRTIRVCLTCKRYNEKQARRRRLGLSWEVWGDVVQGR